MTQTTIEGGLLIRPVARFVAIGLFLMAFFATLWALWALYGLPTVLAGAANSASGSARRDLRYAFPGPSGL